MPDARVFQGENSLDIGGRGNGGQSGILSFVTRVAIQKRLLPSWPRGKIIKFCGFTGSNAA